MKVPKKLYAVASGMLLSFGQQVNAQDVKGTLTQLNNIFEGTALLELDRSDRLTIDLFNEEGNYRKDATYITFLDPGNISYVLEERALVLRCAAVHEDCIDKEVFRMGTIRHTKRSTIPMPPGSPEIERAIMLFSSLIGTVREETDYRVSETRKRR